MKYLPSLLFLFISLFGHAQYYQANVKEDYSIEVKKINQPLSEDRNNPLVFSQLSDFPKSFRADTNTKNFRNVTLEDINNDGIQEIIFAAQNKLIVFSGGTLLWEKSMVGTGIYPPSVADINSDGKMEIVQVTGGNGRKGRVYVYDNQGNNLLGFPKNYSDHWILTAPTLADLDEDGNLEIIFLERSSPGGIIHILNKDGDTFSADWPIRLPGTPAVTPSIGDIDNDGKKEIIIASTTILYAFDLKGELKEGWPVDNPDTKFSFQSPILVDLDGDMDLEIIGATHGNTPEYYIFNHDGSPYKFWPFFVPEGEWTFSTPTVVKINGIQQIFMSRPKNGTAKDMLYSWNEAGDLLPAFPIEKEGGLEGIISIADINGDDKMELIFGSNRLDTLGFGFIHAFNMDGTGEVEGFPLRPKGWTLMNGAALGDINNDGKMDLTALSYTTNFGDGTDSIFLNVYDLETVYHPEKVLWSTYKGTNTRDGNLGINIVSAFNPKQLEGLKINIQPNPIISKGTIHLSLPHKESLTAQLFTLEGKFMATVFDETFQKGSYQIDLPVLPTGIFFLQVNNRQKEQLFKKIISIKK